MMTSTKLHLLSALLLLIAVGSTGTTVAIAQESATGATLFEGARLIRGDGTAPIESSAFLVQGERIVKIGKRGDIALPAGARRVDLSGKTVIPMLMTLHTHPGVLKGTVMSSKNYSRESVIESLRRFAYYGFSAVGSMGVEPGDLPYQIRSETHPGAAILRTAGRGFGWPNQATGVPAINDIPYGVTTPAQGVKYVRELAAKKPDFVKVWIDDRGGKHRKLTRDLYGPIIQEAHKYGLPVAAHVFYLADAHDLVDAGVQGFIHLTRDQEVDDELVRKMKANNVWITPNILGHSRAVYTKTRPEWFADPELAATQPANVIDDIAKLSFTRDGVLLPLAAKDEPMPTPDPGSTYAHLQRSVAKLNRAGVDIAIGPDTGPPGTIYGFSEHLALEALVGAGMSPMEVLVAASSRPARIMKLYDLGSLVEGKIASFVVLNGNPLENIRNTRRIADVYQNAVRLDRAAMSAEFLASAAR